ncbi:VWA domain-containing protein [Luteolibacter arcticus]|uniref:VWA domain-containing protein n=1 Tax=Luteolibacter arcticus TaxID=1581411 RepID=A0ABT3GP31_9BACT|nr:VWA domain-containing protein [Luteolibacter arcticus]MCW1925235.1 VWA domain-containing protein [Luteolibacter arcticus]
MTLAQPAWLLLLLLIPLFAIGAVLTARLRRKQWAAFAAPRLRPKLLRRSSPLPRWLAFSFLLTAVVLLALGLARPQTSKGLETETTKGRNVLLALDLSRSMLVNDLKPDRLTQAKTLCYDLMDALPGDRIGVIAFAGEPYLVAPLTPDHSAARETIDQLDTGYIPVGGTNLEGTLEMAIKTLKETGQKENALIIMTDGDETTGRMMRLAAEAKRSGIYVFTIGMGTELGDFVPDKDFPDGRHRDRAGNPVRSALNAEPLKRMALETGGRFAAATSATSIPEMVKLAISDMEQFEIAGRERFVPIEYFQWFVLPGILMLMASVIAGTRWRGLGPASATATAALVLLFPQPAKAGVEDDARRALAEGRHEEAVTYFKGLAMAEKDPERIARYRLAEGNAAYLQGELESARSAFSAALKSDDPKVRAAAHHGMGSVLFGGGWKRLSRDAAYPNVNPKEDEEKPDAFGRIADSILGLSKDEKKPEAGKPVDPMETFDTMVRENLSEWMQSEAPENGESAGFDKFNSVISDWIDGVKHFDSALRYDSSLENARHNRTLTVKYLKKLREILEEVEENAQQLQPMPSPGEGEGQGDQPQPEGEGGEGDQEGEGKGDQEREGEGGDKSDKKNKGEGGDRPKDGKGDKEGDKKNGGSKPKEGETPEDAARRILRENADFEKGALNPGRLEYRQPEKDW